MWFCLVVIALVCAIELVHGVVYSLKDDKQFRAFVYAILWMVCIGVFGYSADRMKKNIQHNAVDAYVHGQVVEVADSTSTDSTYVVAPVDYD